MRHLSGSYTIHCATDGRQALDLLRSRSIAAVVSDVAMKGMDGVALCAAIRNDPALDHLPVVLVSVDSSSAAKVRALEAGADAYLEKPLSVDYLDCQIRALIGIRGRLRLKFSKMPYLVMDGDAASPSGNRFMAQVNQYVMDNISNSNLSVEDIAAAVNVSRTLFFSRIKSLTGTTPNEFLRSTRLRVAAELLSKPNDLRVTEICWRMVGFTSTSYFAKCFHAQFDAAHRIHGEISPGVILMLRLFSRAQCVRPGQVPAACKGSGVKSLIPACIYSNAGRIVHVSPFTASSQSMQQCRAGAASRPVRPPVPRARSPRRPPAAQHEEAESHQHDAPKYGELLS